MNSGLGIPGLEGAWARWARLLHLGALDPPLAPLEKTLTALTARRGILQLCCFRLLQEVKDVKVHDKPLTAIAAPSLAMSGWYGFEELPVLGALSES